MIEKPKHIEAFEYYYSLGDKRELKKVAVQYSYSIHNIRKWAREFNWQERVKLRDIENAKALEDKLKPQTNKTIVNTKADYRAEIKTQLGILKAILNKSIEKIKSKNIIDINNTSDLKDVINSYDKLCNLDLKLMGEATNIYEFREFDKNLEQLTPEELRKLADSNR